MLYYLVRFDLHKEEIKNKLGELGELIGISSLQNKFSTGIKTLQNLLNTTTIVLRWGRGLGPVTSHNQSKLDLNSRTWQDI